MKYRPFGNSGFDVSALSFGAMRLPQTKPDDPTSIDRPEAIRMIRRAIDQGINYIDTAWPYHAGESETVVGEALQDGYREKAYIADKLPMWMIDTREKADEVFEEQLRRLKTDCVDVYLFHAFNRQTWQKAKELELIQWAKNLRDKGQIKLIGFSFHDTLDVFQEIIDGWDKGPGDQWEAVQIQYNYCNETLQAGTRGLEYAASKGLPIIAMEPLLGGSLATVPDVMKKHLPEGDRSPADWALHWLWDKPEITTVLSGMSTMEQIEQNIASADQSQTHALSETDKAKLAEAAKAYAENVPIPCTGCRYCMPCPHNVEIQMNLAFYNHSILFSDTQRESIRSVYNRLHDSGNNMTAGSCVECGDCEPKCPQKIRIADWLPRVHDALVFKESERSKSE